MKEINENEVTLPMKDIVELIAAARDVKFYFDAMVVAAELYSKNTSIEGEKTREKVLRARDRLDSALKLF